MNIHHLELFYYVAKHGGIASAVRKIPYGIQQPAVSGQIAKLEESLGVKLFNRRPFFLSPAGEELFAFVEPFFANLEPVAKRIQGLSAPQLRIAAPSMVLQEYVPALLQRVREKFPSFRLRLHEASQADAERLLEAQEIDLAITSIATKPRAGFRYEILMELPLSLLVHKRHWLKDAKQLWKGERIEESLITFPASEPVFAVFQRGLKSLGVEWLTSIEVNSVDLIECYVANEFGIGLSADVPGAKPHAKLRRVALEGFGPLKVAALWLGEPSEIVQHFLSEVQSRARSVKALGK